MPNGHLYESPLGLFGFQEEGIALGYIQGCLMAIWDTGTGKTHAAMGLGAMLLEDGENDLILLVCERNKLGEWIEDFARFTSLRVHKHYGQGRQKRWIKAFAQEDRPQVVVTVYETLKADVAQIVTEPGKRGRKLRDGWLMTELRGLRLLVAYDESAKLRNRGSNLYRSQEYLLGQLRKAHSGTRVLGLTATPMERDYEDAFNQARLICPDLMPTVKYFEERFVASRDHFGRAKYRHDRMSEFAAMFGGVMHRKRKTDPDVYSQFPRQVEESIRLELSPEHQAFYDAVEALRDPPEDCEPEVALAYEPPEGLWITLRQIAGYPEALCYSKSLLAEILVEEYGREFVCSLGSVKAERWVERMKEIVLGQGDKVVTFTFFGQSILPLLARDLRKAGIKVYTHHGAMTRREADDARRSFRADSQPCVFLTSDAGARGLNLPEALYVDEFESALTFANRTQRLNRIHRIDSDHPSVTATTYLALGTVEEDILHRVMVRNEQQDLLLSDDEGGENFIPAAERRLMLGIARARARGRNP